MTGLLRVGLLLAALAFASGCRRDAGVALYEKAEAEHRALILQGVPPHDARFDPVREALRQVPAESSARARADALLARLDAFRTIPERPLATGGHPDSPGRCEPLAQALGTAQGDERARLLDALRDCRAEEERRKAHDHAHPPDAHDPPGGD